VKKYYDISVKGNTLHVAAEVHEGGDVLLFLIHGLGCSSESFKSVRDYHFFEGCTVVAPDLTGFGRSGFSEGFSCSLEDHALVCRELISLFRFRSLHVVGHSMGGAIGVLLCTMMGDRTSSFVNVEGNLVAADCGVSRRTMSMPYEMFREMLLLDIRLMADATGEAGVRMWASMVEQSSPEAFNRSAASLVKWSDSGALLADFLALQCPRVYVYGEKNAGIKALSGIGSIPSYAVPGSGHFPMNDNPGDFYRFLSEWLTSQGGQLSRPL